MVLAAIDTQARMDDLASVQEKRGAPRFFALIRSAKLISEKGEFVCVVRDVSSTGVRLRCFHTLPHESSMKLELQNGEVIEITRVRGEGTEGSFQFAQPVAVERLMREGVFYPRRPLRLNIAIPLTLRTPLGSVAATTRNLSQQGCRVEAAVPLALDQPIVIDSPQFPGIRAKVRWRRDGEYGLVFDDTFSLRDFAVHAARLQCPALASGQ